MSHTLAPGTSADSALPDNVFIFLFIDRLTQATRNYRLVQNIR